MREQTIFRFGAFVLDTAERELRNAGTPVRLNPRYFDALALLVRENGRLVEKDRFFREVWRDVPVGDEALTQCVKALRRSLEDQASAPRYIQTVPKYGYRFVAPVEKVLPPAAHRPRPPLHEAKVKGRSFRPPSPGRSGAPGPASRAG